MSQTWERIPLIEAKIKSVIEAADLGITSLLFGTKQREGKIKPPAIWIYPDVTPINDESLALHESWSLRYVIIGMVKSLDPDVGSQQAIALALKASAEFIKTTAARTLDGLCNDIVRTGFIPAQDRVTDDGSVYGAGVEIEIRFTTKEA